MKSYMYENNENRREDDSGDERTRNNGSSGPVRFQSWNRHTQDSHNFLRGDDEDPSDYFGRLHARYEVLSNMESTRKHLTFYTHTNPFGCPWCELFIVAGLAIRGGQELANTYYELLDEIEEKKTHIEQSPPMTTRTEHQNNRPETAAVQNVFYKKEGEGSVPSDDSTIAPDE